MNQDARYYAKVISYVVEYIVDRTLGALLKNLNPRSASKLRILDPASGSGSFLLVAYDRLLAWHLEYYKAAKSKNYRSRIYKGAGGNYFLTVEEKKRILINSIFGVDIDSQAVEVTKLSLLLRVLEGESAESLATQLKLFSERALPDLQANIKCGNSLVQSDFFDGAGMLLGENAERTRVNPFDWDDEFPDVMRTGGFDVVVGNPPYVFTREQFTSRERDYYSTHYPCGWEKRNTYLLFMELLPRLLSESGRGGYIVPNSWLTIESARLVRDLYEPRVRELVDLNYQVFDDAVVEPCIFVADGSEVFEKPQVLRAESEMQLAEIPPIEIDRSLWSRSHGRFVIPDGSDEVAIVDSVFEGSVSIGSVFEVLTGLQAYEKGKGRPPQSARDVANHIYDRDARVDGNSYRYLQGRDVRRFVLDWSGTWMQYGPWLSQPRELQMFTRPRVLIREITAPMPHAFCAAFTKDPYLSNKSVLTVLSEADDVERLKLLEAVMNSRVMSLCYRARAVKGARKVFPKVVVRNLREFPFPMHVSDEAQGRVLSYVEAMDEASRRIEVAKLPREAELATREYERLSSKYESEVCGLYGLGDTESQTVMRLTERSE